jgi:hypothetical protein
MSTFHENENTALPDPLPRPHKSPKLTKPLSIWLSLNRDGRKDREEQSMCDAMATERKKKAGWL